MRLLPHDDDLRQGPSGLHVHAQPRSLRRVSAGLGQSRGRVRLFGQRRRVRIGKCGKLASDVGNAAGRCRGLRHAAWGRGCAGQQGRQHARSRSRIDRNHGLRRCSPPTGSPVSTCGTRPPSSSMAAMASMAPSGGPDCMPIVERPVPASARRDSNSGNAPTAPASAPPEDFPSPCRARCPAPDASATNRSAGIPALVISQPLSIGDPPAR